MSDIVLSTELEKLAKDELREDPDTRTKALDQLRDWISKNPDIKFSRTDAEFLLRFLRTKKFSVPQAQDMIEKYILIRVVYPHWFRGLDVRAAEIQTALDAGYIFPLPERDSLGRTVIFTIVKNLDPSKFTATTMTRLHAIVIESLLDDPENQIRGYVHVNDLSGLTMAHVSLWSVSDIRNIMRCIQQTTPMRHRETHFINLPGFAAKVFEVFTSLLSDKLRKRVHVHKSLEELHQWLPATLLPQEYGGTTPVSQIITGYKARLEGMRDSILDLDRLDIEPTKKSKFLADEDLAGIAGSFRQLQVD